MSNFGSRAQSPASTYGLIGSLLASACLVACGGRSELDDYADGVPAIVPQSNAGGGNNTGDGDRGDGDGDGDSGDGDTGDGDGMAPTGAEIGEACEMPSDCMGGANAFCVKELSVEIFGGFSIPITFPGGACTVRNCTSDKDCPTGSGCLMGFSEPACTRLCTDNTQCRADEGYTCATIQGSSDTRKFCQPPIDFGGFGGGNLPF